MIEKIYYLDNKNNKAIEAITKLYKTNKIKSYKIETVEMNYIRVTLKATIKEIRNVEDEIADLV